MRQLVSFACLFYLTITGSFAQEFGCPLEEGEILILKKGGYSYGDPTQVTTVFSNKQDNVQACMTGKVLDVIRLSDGLCTVIIRTGHLTIAYKYMRIASVVKNQNIEFGSTIGLATFTDGIGYCLDISVWSGTERMDASKLLPCGQTQNDK